MTFSRRFPLLALTGLGLVLGGCVPSTTSTGEENEAHFLKGKARVSGMDYRGAIESFDEALVVNPRSASAHFQLGWLYAERELDPASAIYHYQKYLRLRPNADNAEVIKQHIFRLKQDLAKAVMPLPSTPGVQREFEQLAEENRRQRDELDRLKGFLAARGLSVTTSGAGEADQRSTPTLAASGTPRTPATQEIASTSRTAAMRTHRVQAGESPVAIARKYSVKLDAFMAVNPGLNATRMQVGQVVNVPGR